MNSTVSERKAERYAWIGWAVLFIVTAVIIAHNGNRSVVPAYRSGALQWMAGQQIYDSTGIGGFVYFPQAAVLFVPFAVLPPLAGEILWRFFNIGVFALGLHGFARLTGSRLQKDLFPLMTLIAIPLAWDCARNGQATLMMTGFMLLAVTDLSRMRWWRSVLWLALAVAIKPLALVLVLLIGAIERQMTWRIVAGMLLLALSPFLAQHPAYVLQQYRDCLQNMATAAHVGVVARGWTTPFTGLRAVTGVNVPEPIQSGIRLLAAAGTLVLTYLAKLRFDRTRSAVYLFSFTVLYLILFSPRTENNTYAMLGPAFGVFLAMALVIEKRKRDGMFLAAMVLSLTAGRLVERMAAAYAEPVWLSPLLALCFGAYVLIRFFTDSSAYGLPAPGGPITTVATRTNR